MDALKTVSIDQTIKNCDYLNVAFEVKKVRQT